MNTPLVLAVMLTFSASVFAESPFVGTWKINRDKTQYDPASGILKIEGEGSGIRYSSVRPVYGGPLDGTERPGLGTMVKDTFTLKRTGERSYQATQSRNGKPTVRETIEASPDGKILTSSFMSFVPRKDGKQPTTTVNTYKRIAGEPKPFPFVGTWQIDRKLTKYGDEPVPMIITESGNILTMSNPLTDAKTIIDLDKSEVKLAAANPPTDVTRTVKRISANSFEMSSTRQSVTSTNLYTVMPDGKSMTIRFSGKGEDGKPVTTTSFYDRQ